MDSPREAELLQRLQESQEENARLSRDHAQLSQENALLRQKIDLLVRRIFGASSEKLRSGTIGVVTRAPGS